MARSSPTAEVQARLGRPRAIPQDYTGSDPREDILEAAAVLFTEHGYAQTSTRSIADAVGLRQASLFYYFAKKEDILAELLDRTIQHSLDLADQLTDGTVEVEPDVGLYFLIYSDLKTLFRPPGKLGWLTFQPDARSERFADYWTAQARLTGVYADFIRTGAKKGLFEVDDPALMAKILCGLVEGVVTWFEPSEPSEDERLWQRVASQALRSILAHPGRMPQIREDAERLKTELEATKSS